MLIGRHVGTGPVGQFVEAPIDALSQDAEEVTDILRDPSPRLNALMDCAAAFAPTPTERGPTAVVLSRSCGAADRASAPKVRKKMLPVM